MTFARRTKEVPEMKINQRFFFALVICMLACMSLAQGFGGGRQGGRGGGNSIAGLLRRADVQADLQLTDDQKAKIAALPAPARRARGQNATPPTPEEQEAARAQALETTKQAEAILTPEQTHRVREIRIQLAGERAVLMGEVQTALGVSAEQKAKLKVLDTNYRAANQSIQEKVRSQEIDRAAARTSQQANTETLMTEIHKVVTPAQFDKLKELGGKPFVSTEPARGGRRGGGGGA
jgi:hypothetical protein